MEPDLEVLACDSINVQRLCESDDTTIELLRVDQLGRLLDRQKAGDFIFEAVKKLQIIPA